MEKIVSDFSTEVKLSVDEAERICKLHQGEECCAFLVVGPDGFECVKWSGSATIRQRLKDGTMTAKGEGGWPGCAFEDEGEAEIKQLAGTEDEVVQDAEFTDI